MFTLFSAVRVVFNFGSVWGLLKMIDLATSVMHKVLDLFDRVCAYFKPNREVVVYGL